MTQVYSGPRSVAPPMPVPGLQVHFSRNMQRYGVLRCFERVPVTQIQGMYLELNPVEGARVRAERANWPEGSPRPSGFNSKHEWKPYLTKRSSEGFRVGQLTLDQARLVGWDRLGTGIREAANRAMANLTRDFEKLVTNTINGQTAATMTSLAGGVVTAATESNPYIRLLFDGAAEALADSSYGAIKRSDLIAVMGPTTAVEIASSAEYFAFLKNYPIARDFLERTPQFREHGIVPTIHGIETVVLDDRFVTTEDGQSETLRRVLQGLGTVNAVSVKDPIIFLTKPAQANRDSVMPDSDGVTRVDAGLHGGVLQISKEEMTVQYEVDSFNRLVDAAITNDYELAISSLRSILVATEALG